MFSVVKFLDRAKRNAKIESDYQLGKLVGITQSGICNYRRGKTLPDEAAITKLCMASGDDPAIIAAQIQALRSEKAKNPEARYLWDLVAARLQGAAAIVAAVLCGAMFLGAEEASAESAPALTVDLTGWNRPGILARPTRRHGRRASRLAQLACHASASHS